MELDTQRYSDSDAEWGKSLPHRSSPKKGQFVCAQTWEQRPRANVLVGEPGVHLDTAFANASLSYETQHGMENETFLTRESS